MAIRRVRSYLECGDKHFMQGRYQAALGWFDRALAADPECIPAREAKGRALNALGRPHEALAALEPLLKRAPTAAAFYGTGEAMVQLGRTEDARLAYERAVALAPDAVGYHYALAHVARFVADDTRLPALERLAKKIDSLSVPAQGELHFALGKAYDEIGRCDDAFAHWRRGNALHRRHIPYNEAMFIGVLKELTACFSEQTIARRLGIGHDSELPIFVVGMPRSGTTLVEQILASHPQIAGIGETMLLHELLGRNMLGDDFPLGFDSVPDAAIRGLGAQYAARLAAMAPHAQRVVDKLPANFMLCGLIHVAMPKARIVHVCRDPVDTCFSCYANLFAQNIDYAYDMGELGRYYRAYAEMMAHWRRALPEGAMLDISYEAVVADIETEAKRLIAFCGMAWDDACLGFHNTKRVVHSLSAAQVRQPLYASSVGRWKRYESHLAPLIEAMGPSAATASLP